MRRLLALYDGLPDDARSKREDPDEPHWGTTEELLAQVVEEVSVLAADKRRKDPRTLPRPWEGKPGDRRSVPGLSVTGDGGMNATGLSGMLAATQMRGAVNLGG